MLRSNLWELIQTYIVLHLKFFIFFPQSVYTINHLLDKLNFWISKSVFVWNVIGMSSLTTRFSPGSTRLKMKFFTPSLQLLNTMFGPSRKINVHWSSHSSTKICGTRMDISIFFIKTESLSWFLFDRVSNSFDTSGQSVKDSFDITSTFHWNNPKLILLIDPD